MAASYASSIRKPAIQGSFEINPRIIQIIQQSIQFGGQENEDPILHLSNFVDICDTFRFHGVSDDALRLRLFPFSLRDRAKAWLRSLPNDTITNWEGMTQRFLAKYFPPARVAKLLRDISRFSQADSESFCEAWERFRNMLSRCPPHGLPMWHQVRTFYDGLNEPTRKLVDSASGGTIMLKTPEQAFERLEEIAINSPYYGAMELDTKTLDESNVDGMAYLVAKMEALNNKIEELSFQKFVACDETCGFCQSHYEDH